MPGALSTLGLLPCDFGTRVDAVADPGHRRDQPRLAEALAEPRHRDPDGVGERVCVLVPRPRQELLGTHDSAFGPDQYLQHGELLPGQRNVTVVAVDLATERVQA